MPPSSARSDLAIIGVAQGRASGSLEVDALPLTPQSLDPPRLPNELLEPAGEVAVRTPAGLVPAEFLYALWGIVLVSTSLGKAEASIAERIGYLLASAGMLWLCARLHLRRQTIENAAKVHTAALHGYRSAMEPDIAALGRHREALDRAHRLLHALPALYRQERDSGTSDRTPALDLRYAGRRAALERQVRESGAAARVAAVRAWATHERRLPRVRETAAAVQDAVRRQNRILRRRSARE